MRTFWSLALEFVSRISRRPGDGRRAGPLAWLGSGGGERHRVGWWAEQFAASSLTGRGYHILGRNVVIGPGEIDIVAEHRRRLVFVEVRSRREDSPVRPSSTLTAEKNARVISCGEAYIKSRGLKHDEVRPRYDIAEVYLDNEGRPRRLVVLEAAITDRSRR